MIEPPLNRRSPFTLVGDRAAAQPPLGRQDWVMLSLLLAGAALLRLAFFNGPFGSDDGVYLQRAVEISQGVWSSANYNGALRYGFNIPAGFFIWLFGVNPLAQGMLTVVEALPEAVGRRLTGCLRRLSQPQPASVYRVDRANLWCDRPEPAVTL